jgi:release factor glutamine methyltransferase
MLSPEMQGSDMQGSDMTVQQAQRALSSAFKTAGIDTAPLDARVLLESVTGLDATDMARLPERLLTAQERALLLDYQTQRLRAKPVSKILGQREFWGRAFEVNEHVLDPRPDSETLIEAALQHLPEAQAFRLLDLGTGSGCLLLTLLAERAHGEGLGVDVSGAALAVAQANAQRLGVSAQAQFLESHWFEAVTPSFDMIISNPPYISDAQMRQLDKNVLEYDPRLALHGGEDGLDPYRHISAQAQSYLRPEGWLLFEIGHTQGEEVCAMMRQSGFEEISVLPDLGARDRVVMARAPRGPRRK